MEGLCAPLGRPRLSALLLVHALPVSSQPRDDQGAQAGSHGESGQDGNTGGRPCVRRHGARRVVLGCASRDVRAPRTLPHDAPSGRPAHVDRALLLPSPISPRTRDPGAAPAGSRRLCAPERSRDRRGLSPRHDGHLRDASRPFRHLCGGRVQTRRDAVGTTMAWCATTGQSARTSTSWRNATGNVTPR